MPKHHTTPTPDGASPRRSSDRIRIRIKTPWTAIPNTVLTDTRLSRDARLLCTLLYMHAANRGRTFPSQDKLAEEMGQVIASEGGEPQQKSVSVRSIQRWLNELRSAGWIDWRQTTKNNEYTLLEPDDVIEGAALPDDDADEILTRATAVSPQADRGHDHHGQEILTRTTAVSPSTTTPVSPPMTAVSPSTTTPVSPSTLYREDSYKLESSTSDAQRAAQHAGGDEPISPAYSKPPRRQRHTESSAWLAAHGINAAHEFRDLPMPTIERIYSDVVQRQPDAGPGTIVNALRAHIEQQRLAQHAAHTPSIIVQPPYTSATPAPAWHDDAPDDAPATPEEIWCDAMEMLRTQLPRAEFADLRAELVSLDDRTATVAAPSRLAKDDIERHTGALRAALARAAGRPVQLRVVIAQARGGAG